MKRSLFTILALALCVAPAWAQQAAPGANVTQTGSRGDAAQLCLTAAGTGQQTATLPGVAGQYHYITLLQLALEGTGTVTAASPVPFTTTNIPSTPSFAAPQNAFTQGQVVYGGGAGLLVFNPPIKAAVAGTATTVVGPAAITNASQRITACWYTAP